MLKVKHVSEISRLFNCFINKDTAEEKISEPEGKSTEIIQTEIQREKEEVKGEREGEKQN